ncbi:MAG: Lrp/AsnC family transcriptional regulator [Chloroflexota bacterium]
MNYDDIDLKLLALIQKEGRISNAELARRLNLSPPAAHARMRKLEEAGVIKQYVALLDRDKIGFDLLCFVHIRMHVHEINSLDSFQQHIEKLPQVLECHHITGQYDFILKVAVRNRKDLQEFMRARLIPLRGVAQITTSILLEEIKSTPVLPLDHIEPLSSEE